MANKYAGRRRLRFRINGLRQKTRATSDRWFLSVVTLAELRYESSACQSVLGASIWMHVAQRAAAAL
jgi:hypothetical protein